MREEVGDYQKMQRTEEDAREKARISGKLNQFFGKT